MRLIALSMSSLLAMGLAVLPGPVRGNASYEVLIDLPGTDLQRCASAGDPASPAPLRLLLERQADGHFRQRLAACDGQSFVVVHETLATLTSNTSESGFDRLRARLPRGILPAGPALFARARAVDSAGRITDAIETPRIAPLSLAGNPLPVPSGRWLGPAVFLSLLLSGTLLLGRRPVAWVSGACALLLLPGHIPTSTAEASISQSRLEMIDAGYDDTMRSAAHDLRSLALVLESRTLFVDIAVSNLDGALLGDDDRMLFIGNSLTSGNNLPGMVVRIAAQAGKTLRVKSVLQGGAGLEDHYLAGHALREIDAAGYPLVSLQQGPSSLPESQANLRYWSLKFNAPIRANGGRPLLYMVWPDRSRLDFLDDVRDSYRNAAIATEGAFAPAGIAWRNAWSEDPSLALYDGDQFHPSLLGSHLAALTLFCTIYRQSPEGLPDYIESANGSRTALSPARARLLQRAAWDACRMESAGMGNS